MHAQFHLLAPLFWRLFFTFSAKFTYENTMDMCSHSLAATKRSGSYTYTIRKLNVWSNCENNKTQNTTPTTITYNNIAEEYVLSQIFFRCCFYFLPRIFILLVVGVVVFICNFLLRNWDWNARVKTQHNTMLINWIEKIKFSGYLNVIFTLSNEIFFLRAYIYLNETAIYNKKCLFSFPFLSSLALSSYHYFVASRLCFSSFSAIDMPKEF